MKKASTLKRIPYASLCDEVWETQALRPQNPMQTRPWIEAAVETFAGGQAEVLFVGDENDPDGLAIVYQPEDWGSCINVIGDPVPGESTSVFAKNDKGLQALAEGFLSLRRAVSFGHYPVSDGFSKKLKQAAGFRNLVFARPYFERAWPTLSLAEGWADIERKMSRSRRQSLKRKRRKAEKLGAVRVEVISPTPAQCDELMQVIFQVQAKSWKGRVGNAIINDPVHVAFWLHFARKSSELDQLRLCFFYIGDSISAVQICNEWQNRFWSIQLGYDESFGAISPGELLTAELVQLAAERGLKSFEFCGKEADWTRKWTQSATEVEGLRIYPLNPRGLSTLAMHAIQTASRAVRHRVSS